MWNWSSIARKRRPVQDPPTPTRGREAFAAAVAWVERELWRWYGIGYRYGANSAFEAVQARLREQEVWDREELQNEVGALWEQQMRAPVKRPWDGVTLEMHTAKAIELAFEKALGSATPTPEQGRR